MPISCLISFWLRRFAALGPLWLDVSFLSSLDRLFPETGIAFLKKSSSRGHLWKIIEKLHDFAGHL
jgi:hypothetical protein